MRIRRSLLVLAALVLGAVVAPPAKTLPPMGSGHCTRILCNDCLLQPYPPHNLSCIWVEYEGGCFCSIYGPTNGVETCEVIGDCCTL